MVSTSPASTFVYRNSLDVNEALCSSLWCTYADLLAQLLFLLSVGLVSLFVLVALTHIPEARAALRQERSRTRAERDAFARFARRIADIEVSPTQVQNSRVGTATLAQAPVDDTRLQEVRDAYRETVMDVAHYAEEYDEPLQTNMAAEFGEEVATAIVTGHQFTPQLKGALVQKSRESRSEREEFLRTLDRERDALDGTQERLEDIEGRLERMNERPLNIRSFDDLADAWHRLGGLREECEELLAERQEALADRVNGHRRSDAHTLSAYLYRPLGTTYPALADGTALLDRIDTARHRVVTALTARA